MSKIWTDEEIAKLVALRTDGQTWDEISESMDISANCARKAFYRYTRDNAAPREIKKGPKVLILDIETLPIEAYIWGMWNQNPSLEMIKQHTTILSWSAKWMGAPANSVMYQDVRDEKDVRNDKNILGPLRSLLEESDVILTQNGVSFDIPKINYRLAFHKFKPYSKPKDIDTLKIAKKVFGFDSNKLEHLTAMFCTKYKKSKHKKYPGFSLWKGCMEGNLEAFKEMEEYNKVDVLSLEELYVDHLMPWDDTVNFAAWSDEYTFRCNCGNDEFQQVKDKITKKSRFNRYVCTNCGKEHRDSKNLFSKDRRSELKV